MAAHAKALDDDPDNAEAWRLFTQTITRFSSDLHLAGVLVQRVTEGLDPEHLLELMHRFSILYDVFCPPPDKREEPD